MDSRNTSYGQVCQHKVIPWRAGLDSRQVQTYNISHEKDFSVPMKDKRQVVLDTALTLFRAHGYHAVGVDRVIAESGVAKMTLYKYFPSKNALIEAVLTERNRRFRDSLFAFVGKVGAPQEKLRAVFRWHHDWFYEKTFHGCMFINAAAEFPDIEDPIRQIALRHKLLVQQFIENILCLLISPEQARQLSCQFNQLLDGAIVSAQVCNDPQAACTAWRSAAALLERLDIKVEVAESFAP